MDSIREWIENRFGYYMRTSTLMIMNEGRVSKAFPLLPTALFPLLLRKVKNDRPVHFRGSSEKVILTRGDGEWI